MKKILALLLAAALLCSLTACGKTVITAYGTTATESEPFAPDFAAAYAMHEPDEVVFTVAGENATWQELFYEICYNVAYLQQQGLTITGWDDACESAQTEDGKYYSYGAIIMLNAVTLLEQYHIMHAKLTELGCTPDADCAAYVAQARQEVIDSSFGGDEEQFLTYLSNLYCTEELWNWFNEVDYLYQNTGFETLYGENGSLMSAEDVLTYAEEYGYVGLRQIVLYDTGEETAAEEATAETEDATSGEASDEASGESSGEASGEASAEVSAEPADLILSQLDACGGDPAALVSAFDALYTQYNEDESLDVYTGVRCVWEDDVDSAVFAAAEALDEYGYTLVDTDGAQVVVLRLPCEADADVYYDAETDVMYTLRYYAAWQAYSELVNGENGWLETEEALAQWAPEFENFTLNSVFVAQTDEES